MTTKRFRSSLFADFIGERFSLFFVITGNPRDSVKASELYRLLYSRPGSCPKQHVRRWLVLQLLRTTKHEDWTATERKGLTGRAVSTTGYPIFRGVAKKTSVGDRVRDTHSRTGVEDLSSLFVLADVAAADRGSNHR